MNCIRFVSLGPRFIIYEICSMGLGRERKYISHFKILRIAFVSLGLGSSNATYLILPSTYCAKRISEAYQCQIRHCLHHSDLIEIYFNSRHAVLSTLNIKHHQMQQNSVLSLKEFKIKGFDPATHIFSESL